VAEPFLGQISIFSFNFAPRGWALCNGQLLPINQNQALFSILGTTYGGDGRTNFGLPDFRGRVPLHVSNGVNLGERAGEESHTLTTSEMPAHTHTPVGSSNTPNQAGPAGGFWPTNSGTSPYAASSNSTMAAGAIAPAGGSQPHRNLSPFLTLSFAIALQGIFPSRN
jgi:microcystin-dependent protein